MPSVPNLSSDEKPSAPNSGYTFDQSKSSSGVSKAEIANTPASTNKPIVSIKPPVKGPSEICWILNNAPTITTAAPIPYTKFIIFL